MDNPIEILKIADTRLKEAKSLLKDKHYSGAFYLAGYSVELYLKAKICQNFGIDDLFAKDCNTNIKGISDVRKAVKIHNLTVLLAFSGLNPKYEKLKVDAKNDKIKRKILSNISLLMTDWNEEERYKSDASMRHQKIENMFNSLDDFLQWIKTN